jgi:hypothetical protein
MSLPTDVVRIYPIRTSKKEWNVPIHCYHVCSPRCARMYIRDQSDVDTVRYILVDNPEYTDYKCPRVNKLERTFVRLHSFDIEQPLGGTGPLYYPDMIVIPDTDFSITLSYPLSYPVDVTIRSPTSKGFTLAELIYSIKILYHYIYQEEERTSTPRCYHLKKDCRKCRNKKIIDFVKECTPFREDECSICYNKYSESTGESCKLPCNHVYHKQCIFRWLENTKTCPLCRRKVIECDDCNGSGIIYYDYNGIVIPIEHRGTILNRNTTDGVYGIFGHDLEDLVIEHIHYNRVEKLLTLHIGS